MVIREIEIVSIGENLTSFRVPTHHHSVCGLTHATAEMSKNSSVIVYLLSFIKIKLSGQSVHSTQIIKTIKIIQPKQPQTK